MNRFYGLDLGDAESAVSRLNAQDQTTPEMLPVKDQKSFITAYARTMGGELLIGEGACYASDVTARRLRFKSRFLTDPDAATLLAIARETGGGRVGGHER